MKCKNIQAETKKCEKAIEKQKSIRPRGELENRRKADRQKRQVKRKIRDTDRKKENKGDLFERTEKTDKRQKRERRHSKAEQPRKHRGKDM